MSRYPAKIGKIGRCAYVENIAVEGKFTELPEREILVAPNFGQVEHVDLVLFSLLGGHGLD